MRNKRKHIIFPRHLIVLEQMGENIKLARKRRKITTLQMSERADFSRATLAKIQKGSSSVAFEAYYNVLRVLGLEKDVLKLAAGDQLGRKLQDIALLK